MNLGLGAGRNIEAGQNSSAEDVSSAPGSALPTIERPVLQSTISSITDVSKQMLIDALPRLEPLLSEVAYGELKYRLKLFEMTSTTVQLIVGVPREEFTGLEIESSEKLASIRFGGHVMSVMGDDSEGMLSLAATNVGKAIVLDQRAINVLFPELSFAEGEKGLLEFFLGCFQAIEED